MQRALVPPSGSRIGRGVGRRLALAIAGVLAVTPALALAGTPAAVGVRDFSFGASIVRGSGDKPQSKLWYTDGTWFAGMFEPTPTTWWKIYRFDAGASSWASTGTLIDDRDDSHADYLWVEASQMLYVASAHQAGNLRIYRFAYNAATNGYTKVLGPIEIPSGGTETATIARDSTGRLWTTWTTPDGTGRADVYVSSSSDDGATWEAPFVLPSQGTDRPGADDISAVVAYGSGPSASIGIMYSKQNSGSDAMYFTSHPDGIPSTTGWSIKEVANSGPEAADDHINLKVSASGRLFAATKTGKDGNPDGTLDLILLLERDPATGAWKKHVVGQVVDDQTRPQVVVDDELSTVYVLMAATEADDGGRIHVKTASFADLDADAPSSPAFPPGPGELVISNPPDPKINDPSTAKAPVTAASDLVVIASDRVSKYYLHAVLSLEPSDGTGPTGSVTINGGSPITNNPALTVALRASDPGSGLSRLQLSEDPGMAGATTLAPRTSTTWALSAGDGVRAVYARWRDAAGNWSAVVSDTITLDTVALTGTVEIDGGAAQVGGHQVSVAVSQPEPGNMAQVRLSNSGTTTGSLLDGGTNFPFASPIQWALAPGDGTRTVWAQWQDKAGNWSSPASDSIDVNEATLPPPAGAVTINGGADWTRSTAVTVALSKPAADVTQVGLSASPTMAGATWFAYAPSLPWTLSGLDGMKTVYAWWRDSSGQASPVAGDSIVLDRSRPIVGAPRSAFREGTAGLRSLPGQVLWAGRDAGSGIGRYIVQRSVNGGTYRTLVLPVADVGRLGTSFAPGATYRFRVRAVDRAGNASGWVYGPTFRAGAVQETSRSITYSGRWRLVSVTGSYGGRVKYSTSRGSRAGLRFYGRSVAFITTVGPNRGTARIYINNVLVRTVDLHAPTTRTRQVMFQRTWGRAGWRTISIRVVGTAGHPRVDLDGIGVLR